VVLEESGEAALHRRLKKLCVGYDIDPAELKGRLFYSTNNAVNLQSPEWAEAIVEKVQEHQIGLVILDPLARLKGAADETSQKEMAPVLAYLARLRNETDATVAFVHHTPHDGSHLRGTSDLEAFWESKISLVKVRDGTIRLQTEHRESESALSIKYRI